MRELINLLIVDDHQLVIDGLKSMLSSQKNYVVKGEALNGQQAIEMINSKPNEFQLIITDITMPLLNGIELCKIVKEKYPNIKVLVLSMHNSRAIVKDALNAEADGYMLKNTGQEEFVNAIGRILGDGTYFSQDILPIILNLFQREKKETLKNTLTQREKEVLELIVQEYTSKEIAEKLFISKQTVDTHRLNIMQKTNCKTLVGLIKYAIQSGHIK
ncbi:MAG: response regulator transcription factor [Sphingobacteriaceae bacterium]|nr:response regulator transcription factor [Sphingobacteriaceae bacterium]